MGKNTFKTPPEAEAEVQNPAPAEEIAEVKKEKRKKKKAAKPPKEDRKSIGIVSLIKGILDGSILTKRFVIRSIPMILLLVLLGIFFIANRYQIEHKQLKVNQLKKELQLLRIEHIETKQRYMQASKITETSKWLDSLGIQKSRELPKKLKADKE